MKKASLPEPEPIVGSVTSAAQLDSLITSTLRLLEMSEDDEIDLILEQAGKSQKQKLLYLEKVLAAITSDELRQALKPLLAPATLDMFLSKNFTPFLSALRKATEEVDVVRMTVAVDFKPADIRAMAQTAAKKFGKPVVFDLSIDRALIAGAIIQYGTYLNDYSVKTRLDQFRQKWRKAAVQNV